ncbi:hypothetical protein E3T26_12885 [Cryobacterium sp. TMT1-21]|uniref:hypothetical protein n=1 Tax=unclassified Cryobacterium TaxID=2649013 RepID=UPI00106A130D|nr:MULTISPECIES: hypothetical protein [unclassified Cryobacterium]TFD11313.1 hypothetical protein E3T26_12885 [Cryobacterium sp. TMT1-21]TFD17876.1 hypothetical protein E3T42_07020 [Cryobacterium sp. TMT4-10]
MAISTVLAVSAALLSGCLPASQTSETTATVEAGDGGFSIAVHGVEVKAPAGTTNVGTRVQLDTIDASLPEDVSTFATPTGTAISLTLEGKQPQKSLTATFDIPKEVDPATVFIIGEDPSTGSGVAFVESTFDTSRSTISASVEHLSWFSPVVVEEESFSNQVRDWINESLGTSSDAPDCFGEKNELMFSPVTDNVVWPCATETATGATWSLQSDSGLVWQVLTEPTAQYEPLTSLSVSGIATAAVYNQIKGALKGDSVMLSLETLKAEFSEAPPYTIALKVEPGLSQVATIMWGLSMILPKKWMDLAASGECLVGIVKAGTSSISGESLRSTLGCVGSALEGTGAAILGILLTGPGLLATQLQGLAREITQTNAVQFTLGYRNTNRVGELPSEATWLDDLPQEINPREAMDESASISIDGTHLSFPNSTNFWVGCGGEVDDTTFYPDSDFTTLNLASAVEDIAPEGMTVLVQIGVLYEEGLTPVLEDRTKIAEWTVQKGTITPRQEIDISGVVALHIYTSTTDECSDEDKGYLVLLDPFVK